MNTITIIIITIICILIISSCLYFVIRYFQLKKKKEKIRLAKEKKWLIDNRPIFKIISFKNEQKYSDETNLSALLVRIKKFNTESDAFIYDPSSINPSDWICFEYTLQNIGNSAINKMYLTTNLPKNTSIFDTQNGEYLYYYNNKQICYYIVTNKIVQHNETITIRVCYIKTTIIESNLGNPTIRIWFTDNKNNFWMQDLYAPYNNISDSYLTSSLEFKNATNTELALQYFRDPMLW